MAMTRTEALIERVAYVGDGEVVCRECAVERYRKAGGDEEALYEADWHEDDVLMFALTELEALSRLGAEEEFGAEGLYCDECGAAIVEPWTDEE